MPPTPPSVLEGVRILELARWQAAPRGGMILRDMGAEVIKLEWSKSSDLRNSGPFVGDMSVQENVKAVRSLPVRWTGDLNTGPLEEPRRPWLHARAWRPPPHTTRILGRTVHPPVGENREGRATLRRRARLGK